MMLLPTLLIFNYPIYFALKSPIIAKILHNLKNFTLDVTQNCLILTNSHVISKNVFIVILIHSKPFKNFFVHWADNYFYRNSILALQFSDNCDVAQQLFPYF